MNPEDFIIANLVKAWTAKNPDLDVLTFVDIDPTGPAAQAGVQNGDRVVSVDFQNAEILGASGVAKALEGASVQVTAEVVGPDGHARSVYLTPAGPDPAAAP